MEFDPALTGTRGFWHVGPFSEDPRGIAMRDNIVYVIDGRSGYVDEDTGEDYRGGIKVYMFLLEKAPDALNNALKYLPVRYKVPERLRNGGFRLQTP